MKSEDSETRIHHLQIDHTWDGHPAATDEIVELTLRFSAAGLEITVEAGYHGDAPPLGPAKSTEGLWNHEVVEVFVVGAATAPGDKSPQYVEIELSPHGHWLVLRFVGWRQRVGEPLPLQFAAKIEGKRWRGRARLAATYLPPPPYLAGAFAIHGKGQLRRHLAATPAGKDAPDFHCLESMAVLGKTAS